MSRLALGRRLLSQALLLLPLLRAERGTEVVRLEHLANPDLGLRAREGIGAALDPLDRLSFDFTWISQNPATSSLVSLKGPSITVRFSPENRTRAPLFATASTPRWTLAFSLAP